MKLTIENLKNGDAKLTFNFKGKDYSETWTDTGSGYQTIDGSVIMKLEENEICAEDTDIDDFLLDIDMGDFIHLAEIENEW